MKFGKFELDMLLSQKRFLTLSNVGGFWYNYHFLPQGDINGFGGIGDNQLGVELSGHSKNSYARYSIALLSSVDGNPGLTSARAGRDGAHLRRVRQRQQGFAGEGPRRAAGWACSATSGSRRPTS